MLGRDAFEHREDGVFGGLVDDQRVVAAGAAADADVAVGEGRKALEHRAHVGDDLGADRGPVELGGAPLGRRKLRSCVTRVHCGTVS